MPTRKKRERKKLEKELLSKIIEIYETCVKKNAKQATVYGYLEFFDIMAVFNDRPTMSKNIDSCRVYIKEADIMPFKAKNFHKRITLVKTRRIKKILEIIKRDRIEFEPIKD